MPIKSKVTPIRVMVRGQPKWRVIIPLRQTGGIRKTRWFQVRAKAEEFARGVEASMAMQSEGYDLLGLHDRITVGRIIAKAGGVEKLGDAVEFYRAHNPDEKRSIRQLATECIQSRLKAGASKSYLTSFQTSLNQFSERFGLRDAHAVTSAEIHEWVYAGPWQPETRERLLKDLRTMFNFGLERKYLASNPALAVQRPKITRKEPCILTAEEAERLIRTAERLDPGVLPYIALILFGGLRPEESFRCRWEFIDADHIDLPAGKAKNNKRRLIELQHLPTLRAWLALGGDMPAVNLRKRMDAIRAACVVGEFGPMPPLTWGHDILRHSFVSYAVPIHGTTRTALLADHSEAVLKKHYRALVREADAVRFWGILPKEKPGESPIPRILNQDT